MGEKKHVGRPTNEEVAIRKKKKVIKISLITLVCILLLGGVFIFLNRDNIDFSSIMGASSLKRMKFVLNEYYDCPGGCFKISLDTKKLNGYGYTSCKVNKDFANCHVEGNILRVNSKKKGNINVKVYGKNIKGKTVSKTIRIKVKDPNPPFCNFVSLPSKSVNKGGVVEVVVKCNEKINFNKNGLWYNSISGQIVDYKYCSDTYFLINLKYYERIDDNSYKFYLSIPNDVCSGKVILKGKQGIFKDVNGNFNVYPFQSKTFSIK